ncbi:MAG: hypothetical protein KIT68_05150 [Phycisphaeraceae bacterium]|nr:hypothetical protein [Phycisphaeraceae bacterium]
MKPIALTPTGRTNLMNLGRSRPRLKDGDVFVLNLCGTRWVVGRVVRRDLQRPTVRPILVYFYKVAVPEPAAIRTPILPDLLVPPTLLLDASLAWLARPCNAPMLPEELLPRHVFKTLFDPGWIDEEFKPTTPPGPGDVKCHSFPSARLTTTSAKPLAFRRSSTLRPRATNTACPTVSACRRAAPEVRLFVKPNDVLDCGKLTMRYRALRAAKARRSSGRGCDLDSGVRDATYRGKDPDAILAVVRDTMRRLGGIRGADRHGLARAGPHLVGEGAAEREVKGSGAPTSAAGVGSRIVGDRGSVGAGQEPRAGGRAWRVV